MSDKTIKLWGINGSLHKVIKDSCSISSIAISPDGRLIASGNACGFIKLREIDGRLLKTYKGPSSSTSVRSIAFSPNGKFIAFGSHDHTIELWSIEGGQINTFSGHSDTVNSIVFSPDGKFIASGSKDNKIIIWSADKGLVKTLKGHSDQISSVVFSPDGQHIVSGSWDNTIRIWNIRTGEHASLLSIGNEWLIYTSDGYFDSSRNGGQLVAIVKELTAFGVDQFAIKYNRPDIILKRLGLGSDELIHHYYLQYKKRLRKSGFPEKQLKGDLHVPEAKIYEIKQDGKFLRLSFALSDTKYNLKKYNIYVNDVPLFGAYGKEVTGNNLKKTELIELTSGSNKIEITTFNAAGVESYRALTSADYDKEVKADLYYIGFGVSKYMDSSLNLSYADKDAKDLGAIFSKTKEKFNNIYIKTYLNNEVTIENIKKAKELLKEAKIDDTLVLFVAGHGVYERTDKATYYYLTYDADIKNLSKTAANFDLIEDLLQDIAPRNKLFIMDTCESGEIDEELQEQYYAIAGSRGIKARTSRGIKIKSNKEGYPQRAYLYQKERFIYNDLHRRSGAIVFSSSRGNEFSYESDEIENGFFTEEIINALTSNIADKDGDRAISTDELRSYVSSTVAKQTENKQHPTVDRDNIYQKIVLPITLMTSTSISTREINRDDRFIAYDNGTTKDTKTGLMWASKDNGRTIFWSDAKRYCENYKGGGYTDWRLPTINELAGLYDRYKRNQIKQRNDLNPHLTELIELTASGLWASETRGSKTAFFNFVLCGRKSWIDQSISNFIWIRALPVRGGK